MSATPNFNDRLRQITVRNRKKKHSPSETWPLDKRVEVVSCWLVLGNIKMVAASSGVPYDTIRHWKGTPWWNELEAEIRQSQNIDLDNRLTKIVDRSLEAVLDRVENGDLILTREGAVVRKPASLKDVHKVATDTISKRELIRSAVVSRGETNKVTVEEHLKMLAMEMTKWFKEEAKPIIELEEVEDAVYEERETGLQEGERPVQQSSGEREEEGREEQSSEDLGEIRFGPQG